MVAIILAAGYATRLYPITLNTPKALLKIDGKAMLDHIMDKINALACVRQTVIVCNDKFHKQFIEWKNGYDNSAGLFGKTYNKPIILNDGTTSEHAKLGAIGDIIYALDMLSIDEEVIIIAGDNFFTFSLTDLLGFYRQIDADCVVVKKTPNREALKGFGVAVIGSDKRILDFEEKPDNPKSDYAVFATYIYKRETLPLFRTYREEGNPMDAPGNFPAWLYKKRRVYAFIFDGECYDIGTKDAYNKVCAMFNA